MFKIPVVVIRSNDHCFLDILRSCGSEEIPVIPVVFTWEGAGAWLSEKSKYYTDSVKISNPAENENLAKDQLLELGEMLNLKFGTKILIIPSSDTSLIFLQKYFQEFKTYFYQMGHGDFTQDCLKELSKAGFADLMEERGVNIPETLDVEDEKDVDIVIKKTKYPCVYKPVVKDIGNSFQRAHNQKKAIECKNKEELEKRLYDEIRNGYKLVVQEKIIFGQMEDEISIYAYSDAEGKITMMSGLHKVMEYPQPYGTGIVCKQYIKRELVSAAANVMKALEWHGFACIEFMKNAETGEWVVIEVNLRPWLSIYFQGFLQFNYIAQLYFEIYAKEEVATKPVVSVNNEFLMMDIVKFMEKEMDEDGDVKSSLKRIVNFISSHMGKCVFSYYLPGDEAPGIKEKELLIKEYGERQLFDQLYKLMELNNQGLTNSLKKLNLKKELKSYT
ncbi:ATP-grasp domain-containing protein [Extibacter muris]|uniref:ATP-binding protein n=1 Tax=Extibacter muris TaxID=1796622 RepID=UPI001D07892C|nr:ATP-grasp domain-containing protein [Extibacter muris]MCB6203658.1 ATP-grasp domain-containing protein [Extibacter muris]MCQ4665212.1 ATP-grasp domain-containing protein [Extibacter muris]MCQ4694626.1 ATP-grasp domain-containing protein [Extibacter muris]